jgi:hypothetical protein
MVLYHNIINKLNETKNNKSKEEQNIQRLFIHFSPKLTYVGRENNFLIQY